IAYSLSHFFLNFPHPPSPTLFPSRRSSDLPRAPDRTCRNTASLPLRRPTTGPPGKRQTAFSAPFPRRTRCFLHRHRHVAVAYSRSEEHTSELQSPCNLVCRLLLEKKNILQNLTGMKAFEVIELAGTSLQLANLKALEISALMLGQEVVVIFAGHILGGLVVGSSVH